MPKRLGTTDLKRKSLDDLLMDFYMTKKKVYFLKVTIISVLLLAIKVNAK